MLWWTLQQLKSKDPKSRLKGLEKLASSEDPAAVDPLLQALNDSHAEVRRAAAKWLGKFKDDRAVQPLVKALHDRDASVREAAAEALDAIGDKRAMDALVAALRDDDASVRWQAAHALESLQWSPSNDAENALQLVALGKLDKAVILGSVAIDPLVSVLKSSVYYKRMQAVEALSRLGDSRVIKPLIEALRDPDNNVRARVVEALGSLGDARAVQPLIGMLKDLNPHVRAVAIEALSILGDARAIEPIARLTRDSAWEVRMAAVEALGKFSDPRVISHLVKCLEDKDRDTRLAAVMALRKVGNDDVIEPLVILLADEHDQIRQTALSVLQKINRHWEKSPGARAAIPGLRRKQQHSDYWVRQAATEVLARIDEDSVEVETGTVRVVDSVLVKRQVAVDAMLSALRDADRDLRHAAAIALGCLADKRVADDLSGHLMDPDEWVRKAAAEGLNALGVELADASLKARQLVVLERWEDAASLGEAAIAPLSEASARRSSPIRLAAVQALARIGSPAAQEALAARLMDDAPHVRRAAAEALAGSGWKPQSPELAGRFAVENRDWEAASEGGVHVLPILLEIIKNKDGNPDTWQGAETALAGMYDANAVSLLIELATDPDLSAAIVQALENILIRQGSLVSEADLHAIMNLPALTQHQFELDEKSSSFQVVGFEPVETMRLAALAEGELQRRKSFITAAG